MRFSRDLGEIIDLNDVERIRLACGSGGDQVIIDSLVVTDLKQVAVD